MFKPCIIIPVYNHDQVLGQLVKSIDEMQLAMILVNDGSDTQCTQTLRDIDARFDKVTLVEHEKNGGKGKATKTAFRTAQSLGFTHALQVDADGQHDIRDIPKFITAAKQSPDAIINGTPIYDESVPKHRYYGRYATHVWVWINTLSFDISDSMCGFRSYPVNAINTLIDNHYIGERMDFDIEIIVKSYWQDINIIELPTRVIYPEEGVSHFRVLRDNVRITWLHTRLFFGMLRHLPKLICKKCKKQR